MIFDRFLWAVGVGVFLLLAASCGKKSEVTPPAPEPVRAAKPTPPAPVTKAPAPPLSNPPAVGPALAAVSGPTNAPTLTKAFRDPLPTNAAPAVTNAPGAAQAQQLIDTALKQVDEGQWSEVFQTLMKLKGQELTPDQTNTLFSLMEKLQKMVGDSSPK